MRDLETGIHFDVPESVYHAPDLGIISNSGLARVHQSPAHFKAWVEGGGKKRTDALEFGVAVHCRILEPERFLDEYVVEPQYGDLRYKENKAAREEWRAKHAGKSWVSSDDFVRICGIAESLTKHPIAHRLITEGIREVTLRWDEDGTPCKARVDLWHPDLRIAADLKSCLNASPREFSRSIANWRYHVQRAWYQRGFAAVGSPIEHFAFIAIEKEAPYACAVYTLDDESLAVAERLIDQDLGAYRKARESGEWPAYGDGIMNLSLPAWSVKQDGGES